MIEYLVENGWVDSFIRNAIVIALAFTCKAIFTWVCRFVKKLFNKDRESDCEVNSKD